MLGSSELQRWYANSESMYVQPKVVAEWNANETLKLRSFGHGSGVYSGINSISGASYNAGTKTYTITYPSNQSGPTTVYTITPSSAISPSPDNSYRLFFGAKTSSESLNVTITAVCKDSSGNILNQVSKSMDIFSAEDKWFYADAYVNDISKSIASVEFNITSFNRTSSSNTLSIINPLVYTISQADPIKYPYTSVEDVFSSSRPGEPYSDYGISGNGNVSPYNLAFYKFVNTFVSVGTPKTGSEPSKASIRDFMPNHRAAFRYYLYQPNAVNSNSLFATYDSAFKANKVVVKVNSKRNLPSAISMQIMDSSGVWQNQTLQQSSFNSNGYIVLYCVGANTWSTNAVTTPEYSGDSLPTNVVDVYGIKINFTPNGSDEVHVVEISPRLQLDLSPLVSMFSITKEISNDSLPIPVGIANSNTGTVSFSNTPSPSGQVPFSQYDGPLAGLLKKNVKLKIYSRQPDKVSPDAETLLGTFYSASWSFDGIDVAEVEFYDKIKYLSSIPAPLVYIKNLSAIELAAKILDNVGFTDYYDSDVQAVKARIKFPIKHYWAVKDKSVLDSLQEIMVAYQIAMYVDEFGMIRFRHIDDIVSQTPSTTYAITDEPGVVSGNEFIAAPVGTPASNIIKSNILDFSEDEENKPSSISVEYVTVSPYAYNQATANNYFTRSEKLVDVWNPPQDILGYVRLSTAISKTDQQLTFDYDKDGSSAMNAYSGYLLVDKEIIQFDGIVYRYTQVKTSGTSVYTYVVKSDEERDGYKAELLLQDGTIDVSVEYIINDKVTLANLTRGCFGTPIEEHAVSYVLATEFILKNREVGTVPLNFYQISNAIDSRYTKEAAALKFNKFSSGAALALKNALLTQEHRLFSGTFSLPDNTEIPGDGREIEFGLVIGANSGETSANGVYVGIQMLNKKAPNGEIIKIREGIVVQQFVNGIKVLDRFYRTYAFVANRNKGTAKTFTNKFRGYINPYGENTISVFFANANSIAEAGTYGKMIVVVNGSIIKSTDSDSVTIENSSAIGFKSVSIPSINLNTAISLAGKRFGGYSNGKRVVRLRNLQAIGAVGDSGVSVKKNNLTLLASIINGNALGISNKSEIDSVVYGRQVFDSYQSIEFRPSAIGREIKLFDVEYSSAPVSTFANLYRNDYRINFKVTSKLTETAVIPSDSVTFSVIDHTPVSSRFAMINSFSEPVVINGSSSSAQTTDKVTMMLGEVLVPKERGAVENILDDYSSDDSSVKLKSDWIQSREAAVNVLNSVTKSAIMKRSVLQVSVFGNPLLTLGDVVIVKNSQRKFSSGVYVVVAVEQSFSAGIETMVTLRRIKE